MRRMTVFLALACACALSLAGCAKDAQTSKGAAADNTMPRQKKNRYTNIPQRTQVLSWRKAVSATP